MDCKWNVWWCIVMQYAQMYFVKSLVSIRCNVFLSSTFGLVNQKCMSKYMFREFWKRI